ncbi:MAG: DUF1850 domain-containing protein [Proteobacteria bacterium]|nr:DUF1850 domain-containing protein [Pseudomonadota bacterium]
MMTPLLLCASLLQGPVIARIPLPEKTFDISFTHSLSHTPVVMHFASDGTSLYLTGSDTEGDGADLPYPGDLKMQLEYVTHLVGAHDGIVLRVGGTDVLKPADIATGPWRFAPCPQE